MSNRGEFHLDEAAVGHMLSVAREAASRAYAPYSSFPVGASVLATDGSVVPGANVENASYGLTVCGERAAVFRAVGDGHKELRAAVVSAPKAPGTTPCGACRQVLNEFKPRDGELLVILDHGEGRQPSIVPLSDLLPSAFGQYDPNSGSSH